MKVLWSIMTILAITNCVFLAGCNSSYRMPASSKVMPVIGKPLLMAQENTPLFAVGIPVSNSGPGTLKADIKIKGEPSEILSSQAGRLSGLSVGPEQGLLLFTICEVTRKRTKPIHIEIKWRNDSKNGVSSFTVPPEQTNIVSR